MLRRLRRQSKKAGLPPGSPVFVGERKAEQVTVTVTHYDRDRFEEKHLGGVDDDFPVRPQDGVSWIQVHGLHEPEIVERLGSRYGLHPLILEDVLNTEQRPKLELYDNCLFMVVKTIHIDRKNDEVRADQMGIVLGADFVISFQEGAEDVFQPVRKRIMNSGSRFRSMGPDYLAYALVDMVVDRYFEALEALSDRIEELEDELMSDPTQELLHAIHRIRRQLLQLRRTVWPLRELVGGMSKSEAALIGDATRVFVRDLYDHAVQIVDSAEILREMVTALMEIYLSSVSNRMNEVMKVLTIIATVFIPLSFIAGIFGMNFKYMPELEWRYSYPLVWLVIVGVGFSMLAYFRRKRWL